MGKAPRKLRANNWGGSKVKKNKYISRNDALKYLQLNLPDFRRLCILKGIYPKQPNKKALKNKSKLAGEKAYRASSLYYYVKDIKFMAHDPLIIKFREHKVFMKRLRAAEARNEEKTKESLLKYVKPKFTYDHLVKERYPTFQSALNDLDDCLTLMFMFSKLPSGYGGIEAKKLALVKRLCDEFCTYVVQTRSLKKVFLSFKGIYYQAVIMGQTITWIIPYDYAQQIPAEVDFKVFKTFLTFYTTLQTFVNYKLFHDIGVAYPIKFTKKQERSYVLELELQGDKMAELFAAPTSSKSTTNERVESLQGKIKQIASKENDEDEDDDLMLEEEDKIDAETLFNEKFRKLFDGLTFGINRECPRASLEFIIRCFGGKVVAEEQDLSSAKLTHLIIDRPLDPSKRNDERDYIQPQWVYDSINARIRLPIGPYEPPTSFEDKKKLPPHLSPFVQYDDNSYEPKYAQDIRKMVDSELNVLKKISAPESEAQDEEEEYDSDEDRDEQERRHARELSAELSGMKNEQFQKQLQKEKNDQKLSEMKQQYNAKGAGVTKKKTAQQQKEDELRELQESMMSRRKLKMYKNEKEKRAKKEDYNKTLLERRLRIEEENQQDDDDEPIEGEFEAEAEDQEADDRNEPPANLYDDEEVDLGSDDEIEIEEEKPQPKKKKVEKKPAVEKKGVKRGRENVDTKKKGAKKLRK